jgi:hypothetical protein
MKSFLYAICIIALIGCSSNKQKGIEGKWMMYLVIQQGQDVTEEHDPYDERYVIFSADSTFVSDGRPYGRNTGVYDFNSENSTLFLDSDSGPEDDSQWKVIIKTDTMRWQGYGSEWANDFELIHVRTHAD